MRIQSTLWNKILGNINHEKKTPDIYIVSIEVRLHRNILITSSSEDDRFVVAMLGEVEATLRSAVHDLVITLVENVDGIDCVADGSLGRIG